MPIHLALHDTFRVAATRDIRSWSFGALTGKRNPSTTFDDNAKGTLHDQRIFGPIRDFKCACGKYSGENYANMICDICGVKIASKSFRSTRFGHIEFTTKVRHPLDSETMLSCFPVVPADFIQSFGGQQLQEMYDKLIETNLNDDHDLVVQAANGIVNYLIPVVIVLHTWNIIPACNTLARGVALEVRRE